jgi:6-pyruvoyltetrahydropterin/6-carboxytetrahydropterin synthase
MKIIVKKCIGFCAGHRLVGHGGKCEHFHGHNYRVEISLAAESLDEVGRVVDFADIKRMFKDWIDEHWDHGFLLYEHDDNGVAAIQQVHPCKAYVLPYNPTAENIARYLLDHVAPKLLESFPHAVRVERIGVWENESSCAEVSGLDRAPPREARSWRASRVVTRSASN